MFVNKPRTSPSPRLVPSSSFLRAREGATRIIARPSEYRPKSPFHRLANNLARSHRKFFRSTVAASRPSLRPKRNPFFSPFFSPLSPLSFPLFSSRNNLSSRHRGNRTVEFIAASLPETRPQENLLVKKADLLDLPFFCPFLPT